MLNKSSEGRHLCIVADLPENTCIFVLITILPSGSSYNALRVVKYVSSILICFYHKGYWILSNAFSVSAEMFLWVFSFSLLWCIVGWFVYVEPSL
jgi:hypothetical protein